MSAKRWQVPRYFLDGSVRTRKTVGTSDDDLWREGARMTQQGVGRVCWAVAKVILRVRGRFSAAMPVIVRLGVTVLAVGAGGVVAGCWWGQPGSEWKVMAAQTVTAPAGATGASLYGLAVRASEAGNKAQATLDLQQSASLGYVKAEAAIGADYAAGAGVPMNLVKARYWLQKAADQGDAASETELAEFYGTAEGGPEDQQKAIHYWELAAAEHTARAEFDLGICYELGYGVTHDRTKAIGLLRRAVADDRRIGFTPARPLAYAVALSRAGTRRFADWGELAVYVYPPLPQTKGETRSQQAGVPAGCPGMPSYGFGARDRVNQRAFCTLSHGCPYMQFSQTMYCPRF
jgi:hypothetical protein